MLSLALSALLNFPDVPSGYWAYPAITVMASAGVLHGYTDGKFLPGQALSREQAAAILSRVEGLSPEALPAVPDRGKVSRSLAGDVGAAYQAKIILGTAQGLLDPAGVVTRAEAAAMVARAFSVPTSGAGTSAVFKDQGRIPSYALADVLALYRAGIVEGTEAGYFEPGASVTRAEYSAMLMRAIVYAKGAKGLSDVVAGVVKMVLPPNDSSLAASSPLGGMAGAIGVGTETLNLQPIAPVYRSAAAVDLYAVAPEDPVALWLYPNGTVGFVADLGPAYQNPDVGMIKNVSASDLYLSTGAVIKGAPVSVQYGSASVQGTTFPSYLYGSQVSVTAPAGGTVQVNVSTPFVDDISGKITGMNQAGLQVQLTSSSAWAPLILGLSSGDTITVTVSSSTVVTGVGAGAPSSPGVGDSIQVIGNYSGSAIEAMDILLSN